MSQYASADFLAKWGLVIGDQRVRNPAAHKKKNQSFGSGGNIRSPSEPRETLYMWRNR
jgi:hypothetical protein